MIESIKQIDTRLFLSINSFHTEALDRIMWILSNDFFIYPFAAAVLFYLYKRSGARTAAIALLGIGFCVAGSDLSANLVKHSVKRYRPSHNLLLKDKVHMVNDYKGGIYGFYSSHASNTFSITMLLYLLIPPGLNKKKWLVLFLVPVLISYSRVYLGVHYPSDVMAGAMAGVAIGFFMFVLLTKFFRKST